MSPERARAALDLYISIVWWINAIWGPLFVLAWLNERYRYLDRINAWAQRLGPPVADREEGADVDQGSSSNTEPSDR